MVRLLYAMEASLDSAGNIVSWRHDLWSNGHTHRPGRSQKPVLIAGGELENPFERAPAVDPGLFATGRDDDPLVQAEVAALSVADPRRELPPVSAPAPAKGTSC